MVTSGSHTALRCFRARFASPFPSGLKSRPSAASRNFLNSSGFSRYQMWMAPTGGEGTALKSKACPTGQPISSQTSFRLTFKASLSERASFAAVAMR